MAIACRSLGVLIDGDDDRMDVQGAVALPRCHAADFGKQLQPGRWIGFIRKILWMPAHEDGPPTRLTMGAPGRSAFSRSRSAQSVSILSSIRCSSASAATVEMPAFLSSNISLRCHPT